MLRNEIEELKLESERLKSWVRWFLKEKLRKKGKAKKRLVQPMRARQDGRRA
jgi:hypothetical protein